MVKQLSDILGRLNLAQTSLRRQYPPELDCLNLLVRYYLEYLTIAVLLIKNYFITPVFPGHVFIFNFTKVFNCKLLKVVKVVLSNNHQAHDICRVVLGIKLFKVIHDSVKLQGLKVAS